jgi:hypothetical protein
MLRAISDTSAELQINGRWVIDVAVLDDDGRFVSPDVTVVITSTSPADDVSTPTVERLTSGVYRATALVTLPGRYIATVSAVGYGAVSFTAFVTDVTTADGMPTVQDVRDYAEDNIGSWTDPQIQEVLDSEAVQQRRRLTVGAVYPADVAEALKRRVVRALNLRSKTMPTDFSSGFDGEGSSFIPFNDPEIKRLEAPYRKVVLF